MINVVVRVNISSEVDQLDKNLLTFDHLLLPMSKSEFSFLDKIDKKIARMLRSDIYLITDLFFTFYFIILAFHFMHLVILYFILYEPCSQGCCTFWVDII